VFVVIFVITKRYAAVMLELILSAVSIRNFKNFRKPVKEQKK